MAPFDRSVGSTEYFFSVVDDGDGKPVVAEVMDKNRKDLNLNSFQPHILSGVALGLPKVSHSWAMGFQEDVYERIDDQRTLVPATRIYRHRRIEDR